MQRLSLSSMQLAIFIASLTLAATAYAEQKTKKLIEYGWDIPDALFLPGHLDKMQDRPFDGISFRFDKAHRAMFSTDVWAEADLQSQFDALEDLKWRSFTDNFIALHSVTTMEWFDEDQWKTILSNLRFINRAVTVGRLAGVVFDPEPYAKGIWAFKDNQIGPSFSEVADQVRHRGAQVMAALQDGQPRLRLFTLFSLSQIREYGRGPAEEFPVRLQGSTYALWPAFVAGLLDAAAPGTEVIDGNEITYYCRAEKTFEECRLRITTQLPEMFDVDLRRRYQAHMRVGNATWTDLIMDLRDKPVFTHWMTPQEREQMLEHNVYCALKYADEYAWLYTEKMDWWRQNEPVGTTVTEAWRQLVPVSVVAAVKRGRDAALTGRALPFSITSFVKRAELEERAAGTR